MNYDPKKMRENTSDDPHKPVYHFTPPANWLNDPNGLIQWNGRFHLFYQHNPDEPLWGNIHWGHAVSEDLINWEDLDLALYPTERGMDENGCFTGCAVDDGGDPTLVYTGVKNGMQRQLIARAIGNERNLINWDKPSKNPVIGSPPPGIDPKNFRDPFVWKENGVWHMILGAHVLGKGGGALRYTSDDLIDWEYHGVCHIADSHAEDTVWECPGVVRFDDFDFLYGSLLDTSSVEYVLGNLGRPSDQFDVKKKGILDAGDFYAPQVFTDDKGRNIMFGWVQEAREEEFQIESGWSGAMSLPREIKISSEGELVIEPVSEVEKLRTSKIERGGFKVEPNSIESILEIESEQKEIEIEINEIDSEKFGFTLYESPDKREQTLMFFDKNSKKLIFDRRRSSLDERTIEKTQETNLDFSKNSLSLDIFLDKSVVEVFINDRTAFTSRIYPIEEESEKISIFSSDGSIKIDKLDVWEMKSIWPDI